MPQSGGPGRRLKTKKGRDKIASPAQQDGGGRWSEKGQQGPTPHVGPLQIYGNFMCKCEIASKRAAAMIAAAILDR